MIFYRELKNMKYLLILTMLIAAAMLITYFIAAYTENYKIHLTFRVLMLLVILLLFVMIILSIVKQLPFYPLLALLIIFLVLFKYSAPSA